MNMEWDEFHQDDNPITVCTRHRRFVPCRRDGVHVYSDIPEDIVAVREYQQGVIRDFNEERHA